MEIFFFFKPVGILVQRVPNCMAIFIMCTLHQNIPFYVLFPIMCLNFKTVYFMKVLKKFLDLKFDSFSPKKPRFYEKRKNLTSNQENIGENSLLLHLLFGKRYDMKMYIVHLYFFKCMQCRTLLWYKVDKLKKL